MAGKADKCCCCIGRCSNVGSIFNQCTVCAESPKEWSISDWGGVISHVDGEVAGDIWSCCYAETVGGFCGPTGMVSRLLTGSRTGSECKWVSTENFCKGADCSPASSNHWELTITDLAPGGVTLSLVWSNGDVSTWVNRFEWRCLCKNEMRRDDYLAVGDLDRMLRCGMPDLICLAPVPSCCPERTIPLARTLYVTLTVSGSCACLADLVIPLVWDPFDEDGKYVSVGAFGSCGYAGCQLKIRLYCTRILGGTVTNWFWDAVPLGFTGPYTFGHSISGECEPLLLTQVATEFAGCCGSIMSTVTVTFHE